MKQPMKLALFPLLLVFYEISTYLSNDMYLPALPQMMRDLGLSTHQAQFTLTTWFVGQACMPLIMGVLSNRYGRRPILLIGGVVYLLATALCAFSSSVQLLLIGRLIEGGMVASMLVPGYACIHELYEKNEAIKILALMGSISVLAPAFGPLLGGIVLYVSDWRGIFVFILLWAFIAILLLSKWMPETLPAEKRQPIQLIQLSKQYWRVLANKHFMLLMFVLGFIFAGFISWIAAGSLLVIDTFHFSAIAFGIIQAGIFIAYIFGNRLVKYLLDSWGANKLIRVALGVTMIGGVFLIICAQMWPHSFYPFLVAMIIYSLGSGLCFAPLNRIIIEQSDEPMGIRVALFTVFFTSFAALGSAAAGIFYDGSLASLAYLIASAILLSCLMKVLFSLLPAPNLAVNS